MTGDLLQGQNFFSLLFKADMKSYKPLETAAIFFSSEPFSETRY